MGLGGMMMVKLGRKAIETGFCGGIRVWYKRGLTEPAGRSLLLKVNAVRGLPIAETVFVE